MGSVVLLRGSLLGNGCGGNHVSEKCYLAVWPAFGCSGRTQRSVLQLDHNRLERLVH